MELLERRVSPRGGKPSYRPETPLQALFRIHNMNQREFAELVGVTPPVLSRVLSGVARLSERYADALVGVFGEDVREVIARHIEFCGERK